MSNDGEVQRGLRLGSAETISGKSRVGVILTPGSSGRDDQAAAAVFVGVVLVLAVGAGAGVAGGLVTPITESTGYFVPPMVTMCWPFSLVIAVTIPSTRPFEVTESLLPSLSSAVIFRV
jgi:hypothetical protein